MRIRTLALGAGFVAIVAACTQKSDDEKGPTGGAGGSGVAGSAGADAGLDGSMGAAAGEGGAGTAGAGGTGGAAGDAGASGGMAGSGGAAGLAGADAGPPPWSNPWPTNVILVELDSNDEATLTAHDLAMGQAAPDLAFAANSSVACFPATRFDRFEGNHVFYALKEPMPPKSQLVVEAVPGSAVDVSLYALRMGATTIMVPPNVPSVTSCEASYDITPGAGQTDPGATESIEILNPTGNPYNILWGVAGSQSQGASGAYDVNVKLVRGERCVDPRDPFAPAPTQWPGTVTQLDLAANSSIRLVGKLDDGAEVCPLDWAWSSQIACFPQNEETYFQGNHVFYAFRDPIPGRSVLNVTVTPDPGVEVSAYAIRMGTTDYYTPPLPSISVNSCEASYPVAVGAPANPGEAETIQFQNPGNNSHHVFFAVAGDAATGKTGGYTIDAQLIVQPTCSVPSSSPTAWPGSVTRLDLSSGTSSVGGDLAAGASLCSLDWAAQSNVACFPLTATARAFYEGNHVFYALRDPLTAGQEVTVTVTPAAGVEVSLYGWWAGVADFYTPPFVPSVGACEASYGTPTAASNPGQPETITFSNVGANSYNYFFAVAGDDTTGAAGAYTVDVTVTTAPPVHCGSSLPGASYSSWPSKVTTVPLNATGKARVTGNLSTGSCTNLSFADDSDVACFPATRNTNFEGNHVFYALQGAMPPRSILDVTVTPDPGVEVNAYGYQAGTQTFYVPPKVTSVPVCEASYPASGAPNPGAVETLQFQNPTGNSYNIFVGVAGDATTGTTGGFAIDWSLATSTPHCPGSLPGTVYSAWPPAVTLLTPSGGLAQATGNLSNGTCMNLDWADDSSVACFPATRNYFFEGNHVFYALDRAIQGGTEVTVAVQPQPGVEVSLYAYIMGENSFMVPPRVPSVLQCEASYPVGVYPPPNPGQVEQVGFSIPSTAGPYNLFVGVAGDAPTGTTGGYTVYVQTSP